MFLEKKWVRMEFVGKHFLGCGLNSFHSLILTSINQYSKYIGVLFFGSTARILIGLLGIYTECFYFLCVGLKMKAIIR